MQELNRNLLIYLNSLLDYPIIEKISLLFSDIPIFFLPIFLVSAWIYYTYKNKNSNSKKDLLFIFYGSIITIILNLIIQNIIKIDRPETALEGRTELLLSHIPDASFPSDHTAVGMAFIIGLFLTGYKKIGIIFSIIFIIMIISRVILGVHWPFDIIGGICVGIVGALISFKLLKNSLYIKKLNEFLLRIANYIKL